jgi:preprotein translocase subunit SecA
MEVALYQRQFNQKDKDITYKKAKSCLFEGVWITIEILAVHNFCNAPLTLHRIQTFLVAEELLINPPRASEDGK